MQSIGGRVGDADAAVRDSLSEETRSARAVDPDLAAARPVGQRRRVALVLERPRPVERVRRPELRHQVEPAQRSLRPRRSHGDRRPEDRLAPPLHLEHASASAQDDPRRHRADVDTFGSDPPRRAVGSPREQHAVQPGRLRRPSGRGRRPPGGGSRGGTRGGRRCRSGRVGLGPDRDRFPADPAGPRERGRRVCSRSRCDHREREQSECQGGLSP